MGRLARLVVPELLDAVRLLFRNNWKSGAPVPLLGVHAGSLARQSGQLDLLDDGKSERWRKALTAADRLRDKFRESAVSLGSAVRGAWRERTHENPAGLPGRSPTSDDGERRLVQAWPPTDTAVGQRCQAGFPFPNRGAHPRPNHRECHV